MTDLLVRDLTVEYNSAGYVVRPLDKLSLHASDGELVILLGPSGCGKTTLLSCLAGLLTPTSGSIRLAGREVVGLTGPDLAAFRRDQVGVVFQAFNLLPSLTALGNVVAPMALAGVDRRRSRARASELLDQVGLTDRMHHRPGSMSGGQQQRVAIARALVHNPRLVLAYEPTAHLDHVQVEGVLRLIRQLASPGRLVVVSTHDDRVANLAYRVVELVPSAKTGIDGEPIHVALNPGQILFHQGEPGDLVFVVLAGEIELLQSRADGGSVSLGTRTSGDYFGELSPLLRTPRSATARARGDAVVVGYPLQAFRRTFPTLTVRDFVATGEGAHQVPLVAVPSNAE